MSRCTGCSCGALGTEGVTRRDFVARTTLAAIATLLAACGDGVIGATAPPLPGTPGAGGAGATLRLADYPALATVGGMVRVDTLGTPIALVRSSANSIAAFSMVCPHQGTTVNITGGGFRCPNHGATFANDGRWTGGQQTGSLVPVAAALDLAGGVITLGAVAPPANPPTQPGTPPQPAGNVSLSVRLADFPALGAVGGIARVDRNGPVPVGVARTGASSFAAYALVCPHQGATVAVNGSGWRCPSHGATFDATGRVTSGPATSGLSALGVTFDAATGTLAIGGNAPATTPGGGGDDDDDDGRHH